MLCTQRGCRMEKIVNAKGAPALVWNKILGERYGYLI